MIVCSYDELRDIDSLLQNEKNRNEHSEDQIKQLVKIIDNEGWRFPILVSKRDHKIVSGHGRLLAAKVLQMTQVPVVYQDFDSEEQQYRVGIADNAVAKQSKLNIHQIHLDLPELEPFDIELLGIKNFAFEPETDKVLCKECGRSYKPK